MAKPIRKTKEEDTRILNANKWVLYTVSGVFGLYCLTLIFPFLWLLINSVKGKIEFLNEPMAFPKGLLLSNYVTMFVEFNLAEMFVNTLLMCLVLPTIEILVTCGVAYAMAVYNFKLRPVLYVLIILNIYVSLSGSLPTTYRLLGNLNLLDEFAGLMFMGSGGLNFHTLIVYGIFVNISKEYKEAAQVDGAGHWRIYLQIYIPQVFTTLLSLWLLSFIGQWNNFTSPYLFWNSHQTLATGLKYISDNISQGVYALEYPKLFAAMVITIIPVIIVFACFQKPISKLSAGGGVKG